MLVDHSAMFTDIPTHHTAPHHIPTHHTAPHQIPTHHTAPHHIPTHHTATHHIPTHHIPKHHTPHTTQHHTTPRYIHDDKLQFTDVIKRKIVNEDSKSLEIYTAVLDRLWLPYILVRVGSKYNTGFVCHVLWGQHK
jgi:hypothetical protein